LTANDLDVIPREDLEKSLLEQAQVRASLSALADCPHPPSVLLLEGGTALQRLAAALYWAAGMNCREHPKPCMSCRLCGQVLQVVHQDVILLDGGKETIKIDPVRDVRSVFGQAPKGEGRRVVILAESQEMTTEAANCLLKSMEEPGPFNLFVLTAPQREMLLPTLVSRSWVVTLGWPGPAVSAAGDEAAEAMMRFAESGRGWFRRTAGKGSVDARLVAETVAALQRRWIDFLAGRAAATASADKGRILRSLPLIDRVQEGLAAGVNPALCLDWLALGLWEACRSVGTATAAAARRTRP
jgi:DNA polymerase III subunit delta'